MTQLDRSNLTTYLNDHLAGSVAALELMNRLCAVHTDSLLGRLLAQLRADVSDEQQLVRQLLSEHGGTESAVAQTVAWLGEKVARLKIGPGQHDDSGLVLFETLEALSLGFWGRGALWRTLEQLQRAGNIEAHLDFGALAARATRHLEKLEESRLLASFVAFSAEAMA